MKLGRCSVGLPTAANATVALAQFGRVLAALGAGRHADAYETAELGITARSELASVLSAG